MINFVYEKRTVCQSTPSVFGCIELRGREAVYGCAEILIKIRNMVDECKKKMYNKENGRRTEK